MIEKYAFEFCSNGLLKPRCSRVANLHGAEPRAREVNLITAN